ncbi:XRE family transcriptional regulator [Methylobacterium sp. WL120]|uniref:helix-turn-helix domain-containing protein n=1 Tax=Methylobacterium sp. WL120 TaxID=2603887 RepID=UPI00164F6630|nr:XRE family transcriptional regulator [Methylobacterium sp. WL120]
MPELKRRRKALKLSLDTVAQRVGLSTSQVQRFETGEREPKKSDLERLAALLECRVEDLLQGASEARPAPAPLRNLLPIPLAGRTAAGVYREVVEFNDAEPDYVFEPEDEDFPKARRFALEVEGDSMNQADPPIPDGARVVCVDFGETGQPFQDGMIVVLQRTREGGHLIEWSVKEIELHDDEVWFCPRSSNKRHKPIKVVNNPSSDEWNTLEVIGLVRDVSMRVRAFKQRRPV